MDEYTERWRAVVGYEGIYEVSNHGRLRSLSRKSADGKRLEGRLLRQHPHPRTRHLNATLTRDGKCTAVKVHRVVLEAFVGPCPDGMESCHGNGDPTDNRVANLRWDTPKSNGEDRVKHGSQYSAASRICGRGHAITEPNVNHDRGRRRCKACALARQRAYDTKRKISAAEADRIFAEMMGAA